MKASIALKLALGLSLAVIAGCGESGSTSLSGPPPDAGATIVIQGYAYSPLELTVDAGTVIAVHNLDEHVHTVTSESSDNAFIPGRASGVAFDSGNVDGNAWGAFTVPADAPSGATLPYYCATHGAGMKTPNGHIHVR
jgi:plastocyanin